MRNITITMDETLVLLTEAKAAEAGKSLPDFILELVSRGVSDGRVVEGAGDNPQIEALRKIWAGPMWDVTENGRMPNAEERNARR